MSTATHDAHAAARRFLSHGGDMGVRIAGLDLSTCPLGAIGDWSPVLRHTVATLLPSAAQIVLFWGPDYIALYNDAYSSAIGNKHPRALGRPARESWSEMWDDLEPLLAGVRNTGVAFARKNRAFRDERSGSVDETFFDISYSAVPGEDGSIEGVLCIVSETTDRIRAERQLADDRARLTEMFDQSPSFMAVLRQPGHVFEFINTAYLQLVGHRDLIGRPIREALPELAAQGFLEILDAVVTTHRPHRGDGAKVALQRTPDGPVEDRYADFVFQPIEDRTGAVTAIFVVGSDVTDRMRAKEELAVSEESMRLATEAAQIGTWDHDPTTTVLGWSDRTKAMFGISPSVQCTRADFHAGLHPDDREATLAAFAAMHDPSRRAYYDVEYRTVGAEDGLIRWVAARGRGIFSDDGRCIRAIGTTIEITQRKMLDAALRESEERFRSLADSAPAMMWIGNGRGGFEFVNRWYFEVFGEAGEAALHEGWHRVIHPDDVAGFASAFGAARAARRDFHYGVRVIDRHGRTRWLQCEGRPRYVRGQFAGYVGCSVDATDVHIAAEALERGIVERTAALASANAELTAEIAERERVEATLHQMQRLEAVGQLTSGVAHDFNNLLTVVLGNVGMIDRAVRAADIEPKVLTRLEHVRTAAERGAALTAQLLAFSRRQRLEAKVVDLNATVAGMQDLLRNSIGNAITIDTHLYDRLWPAMVDPTQIELIILNLAINARDAMDVGGTVRVETANVTMSRPERPEDPPAGDHVRVSVSDTGSGMTPDVLAKAFEPFFTTKEVGKGSGLGLAQVFGFAKQSGGGVRIDTIQGKGTTVGVYLPRSELMAIGDGSQAAWAREGGMATGARVLVVDDDAAVRSVTADTLAEIECVVTEADGGVAAIALLQGDRTFDLLVVDFAMPNMNGAEFARRARALHPALPLLMVTGYADRAAMAGISDEQIVQKPFDPADLQDRARRALGLAR